LFPSNFELSSSDVDCEVRSPEVTSLRPFGSRHADNGRRLAPAAARDGRQRPAGRALRRLPGHGVAADPPRLRPRVLQQVPRALRLARHRPLPDVPPRAPARPCGAAAAAGGLPARLRLVAPGPQQGLGWGSRGHPRARGPGPRGRGRRRLQLLCQLPHRAGAEHAPLLEAQRRRVRAAGRAKAARRRGGRGGAGARGGGGRRLGVPFQVRARRGRGGGGAGALPRGAAERALARDDAHGLAGDARRLRARDARLSRGSRAPLLHAAGAARARDLGFSPIRRVRRRRRRARGQGEGRRASWQGAPRRRDQARHRFGVHRRCRAGLRRRAARVALALCALRRGHLHAGRSALPRAAQDDGRAAAPARGPPSGAAGADGVRPPHRLVHPSPERRDGDVRRRLALRLHHDALPRVPRRALWPQRRVFQDLRLDTLRLVRAVLPAGGHLSRLRRRRRVRRLRWPARRRRALARRRGPRSRRQLDGPRGVRRLPRLPHVGHGIRPPPRSAGQDQSAQHGGAPVPLLGARGRPPLRLLRHRPPRAQALLTHESREPPPSHGERRRPRPRRAAPSCDVIS
ncbi:hypothetical protein M885DRAFT_620521, partial [Pelagophyceae sp. CCMP2097]